MKTLLSSLGNQIAQHKRHIEREKERERELFVSFVICKMLNKVLFLDK